MVDILLQVMVASPRDGARASFSPEQVGCLFTFLARQMARYEGAVAVDPRLFGTVLEHLTAPGDPAHHEERQQALLELLAVGGLAQVEPARLLHLARQAQFYRACQLVHTSARQFDKVVDCFVCDPARQAQVRPWQFFWFWGFFFPQWPMSPAFASESV